MLRRLTAATNAPAIGPRNSAVYPATFGLHGREFSAGTVSMDSGVDKQNHPNVKIYASDLHQIDQKSCALLCDSGMNLALDLGKIPRTPRNFQVMKVLQVQPKLGVRIEIPRKA